MNSFEEDLRLVINRHSAENPSGTPDYILAKFLVETLKNYNEVIGQRAEWRGESVELPSLIRGDSECTCFVTPEHTWFRYGSAVEPGSQMEPNPDCPEHSDPDSEVRSILDDIYGDDD